MRVLMLLATLLVWEAGSKAQVTIRINGSTTVNPVVVEMAEVLEKKGWRILVDTQGGSGGGISFLAEGMADIGMSSRELVPHDQNKYPGVRFLSHTIGYDGVALVVSSDLYESGVKALAKDQIKGLYEGKIKNWKDVGGPDRPVVFFNKEPGRGTWEVFANFLYEKASLAPRVFHPEVGANQEARSKVARHKGGITQLSASWAVDNEKVRALAIVSNQKTIAASLENIEKGEYPMRRPLLLITNGPPQGEVKEFLDFALSEQGQGIVKKYGYLPVKPEGRT